MLRLPVLALVLAPYLAIGAQAQVTVTLESSRDCTLYQQFQGNLANGQGKTFFVGRNNDGRIRRGLLDFDLLAAVPPGSTLTDARLLLECTAAPMQVVPTSQSLHRALAPWGEGPSSAGGPGGAGAPSQNGDATWQHTFFPSVFWANAGGDFDPAPIDTLPVVGEGSYVFAGPGLLADCQAWLDDPASHHGWLMKDDLEPNQSARRYGSHEADEADLRPRLELTFLPPAVGSPYCGPGVPNSTGQPGTLRAVGSADLSYGLLTLTAEDLPPSQMSWLLAARAQATVPLAGGQGTLCLGGPIGRFAPSMTDAAGELTQQADLAALPIRTGTAPALAGESWFFQAWSRDLNPQPTSNFSDGLEVLFQ